MADAPEVGSVPKRWVMITPSYRPDLERCRVLCHSVDLCVPPEVPHVLVVDRRDYDIFSSLASVRRHILVVEDMLPWWIFRLPLAKRWWFNLFGKPVRNWVLQQIAKIQAAATVDADAVLFLDSDVAFVRPFSPQLFEQKGKIALNKVVFSTPEHTIWRLNASKMVNVMPDSQEVNYIGNLISWRVDMAQALVLHLGRVRQRHWIREFTSFWQVSEYMVYGTFVERVVGMDKAGHFPSAMPIVHVSWEQDLAKTGGLEEFFADLEPNHLAVMIHSKDGIAPERYLPYLQRYWEKIGTQDGSKHPLEHAAIPQ